MRFKKYYNGSQRLDCIVAATLVLGYGAKWWQNVKICHQQPQNVINSTLPPTSVTNTDLNDRAIQKGLQRTDFLTHSLSQYNTA